MNVSPLVGNSAWSRLLRENIQQVARFPANVLVTGPSGTGKELIARAIHCHSPRSSHPFVPVDCTSLTGELFASHLFGHAIGAFTGANYERMGCFRAAEGGTILMDEIGELNQDLQCKLLRAIQEREVVPVGCDRAVPIDVRIIAATNRDLSAEVKAGRFRLDLFYRLNVVAIEAIALRERPEDIEPLADHFLHNMAVAHGYPLKRVSDDALDMLRAYPWPGNIRQLQNVLECAVVFAKGDVIDADALPAELRKMPAFVEAAARNPLSEELVKSSARELAAGWSSLADVECEHIRTTLSHTAFNRSAAADLLRINRATLARKIGEYHIALPAPRRGRPRMANN